MKDSFLIRTVYTDFFFYYDTKSDAKNFDINIVPMAVRNYCFFGKLISPSHCLSRWKLTFTVYGNISHELTDEIVEAFSKVPEYDGCFKHRAYTKARSE